MSTIAGNKITHVVSVDFGSETTTAYCTKLSNAKADLIKLQDKSLMIKLLEAQKVQNASDVGDGHNIVTQFKPTIFFDSDGNTYPLRNRFQLAKAGQELPEEHAEITFFDNPSRYNESIFRFFCEEDEPTLSNKTIPNPKILALNDTAKLLTHITIDDNRVQFGQKQLLTHLICQIVNNFVINGLKELEDFIDGKPVSVNKNNVHLILSFPNIYDLRLIQDILNFLKTKAGVGKIEHVYESDAIIGYIHNTKIYRDFCKGEKSYGVFSAKRKEHYILTMDVGRGTTDLSLVKIEGDKEDKKSPNKVPTEKITKIGSYGLPQGGNTLNYIFAGYYNRVFENLLASEKWDLPFNFIEQASPQQAQLQRRVLEQLEKLIEQEKKRITKSFELDGGVIEQNKTQEILETLWENIKDSLKVTTGYLSDPQATRTPLEDVGKKLIQAFSLNSQELKTAKNIADTYGSTWVDSIKGTIGRFLPKSRRSEYSYLEEVRTHVAKKEQQWAIASQNDAKTTIKQTGAHKPIEKPELVKLVWDIKLYIAEIARVSIDRVIRMANVNLGTNPFGYETEYLDKRDVLLIIAGQAAYFAPLKNAIEEAAKDANIHHIKFLDYKNAKYACCKGAANYAYAKFLHAEAHPIDFGTYMLVPKIYSFFAEVEPEVIYPREIRKSEGRKKIIDLPQGVQYILCYFPYIISADDRPKADDETGFLNLEGAYYYEGSEQEGNVQITIEADYMTINGKRYYPKNFSDIPEDKQLRKHLTRTVYSKLWPEALYPTQQ